MSGLLRRLTRRGPATADENRPPTAESSEPAAAPAETPAEPGGGQPLPAEQPTVALPPTSEQPAVPAQPLPAWTVAASQPTAFAAQPAPARDLPAGVDPGDLAAPPEASARRGKLRRRLRYLRHVRELLLRDLGGFTYEVHRTAGGTAEEPQRRLTAAKAERISVLDAEVLALEARLGEPHAEPVLREPGIGGTCRECGELHASDAHFCSRCGAPLDDRARAQAVAQPATGSHTVAEPQPASVLWAGGPRPAAEPAPAAEEEAPPPPSAVTSQWLVGDQPTTFERAAQGDQPAPQADTAKPDPAAAPKWPAAQRDEAKADAPAARAGEAKPDAPAAQADEPGTPDTRADEPAAAATPDEPAAVATPDEPAAAATPDEPAAVATPGEPSAAKPAPAKPKRKPRKPAKRAPAKPRAKAAPQEPESRDFEANGRRDEDVPPPITSPDPLASPQEPRP